MMLKTLRYFVVLVFSLQVAAPCVNVVSAQDKELIAFRDRWAILIGVGKYSEDSGISPLWYPAKDVEGMKVVLISLSGFKKNNMISLVDRQATYLNISKGFQALMDLVGEDDLVLFYFSGRGARINDDLFKDEMDGLDECLLPYDAEKKFVEDYFRDDEIGRYLGKLGAKRLMIINDNCYSGQRAEEKGITTPDALAAGDRIHDGITKTDYLPSGTVVLEACGSEETTKDGVFTSILIRGLEGRADSDGDGTITAAESFDYVQKEMKRRNINQTPQLLGTSEAARIALVQLRPAKKKEVADSTKTESKVEGEQKPMVLRIEPARIHIRADTEIAGKRIENIPLDAKIYLDSMVEENLCAETIPAILDSVPPGEHKLIVHIEGQPPIIRQISVKSGESVTESIPIAQSVAWQASLKLLRSTPQDKDRLEKAQEVARALGRSDVAEIFEKRIEQGK